MLLFGSSGPPSTVTRGRPQIAGGTLRTDTGVIMRAGRVQDNDALAKSSSMWAAGRALGLNTMRVGVKVGSKTIAETMAATDLIVNAARNNSMYVLLGNPETTPGTWDDNLATNRARKIEIWSVMADRYKDESHVFYEMLNEPEAWGLWSHYANASDVPTDLTVALRDVYNVMRSAAPDTLVLLPSCANLQASGGAQQYINAIQAFETLGPVDWTRTLWSFHYYDQTQLLGITNGSATDGGRAGMAWLRDRYPFACTETNWFIDNPPREWLVDAVDAMEDVGVGWSIMRRPGQSTPAPTPLLGPLYLENKIAQLRDRGYVLPVE